MKKLSFIVANVGVVLLAVVNGLQTARIDELQETVRHHSEEIGRINKQLIQQDDERDYR